MNRNLMVHLVKMLLENTLTESTMLLTFREAGILTNKDGLIVRFTNGNEFEITVVQSKINEESIGHDSKKSSATKIQMEKMDYPQNTQITGKSLIHCIQKNSTKQGLHG